MTVDPDPYRTLGLSRGASLDQIKAAYRRLAKANHPDAAGASALPRFLAIQAAYEQIVRSGPKAAATRRASRPSSADSARTDATNRAYGARGGRPRSGPAAGATPGGAPSTGRRPSGGPSGATGASSRTRGTGTAGAGGASTRSGASGAAAGDKGASGASGTRRRNKATLGSTSYDDADSTPFEPDWGGASWYGTTSGTYWTLNPKEYADPRKHGPEYQARARRATGRATPPSGGGAAAPAADAAGPAAGEGNGAAEPNGPTTPGGPTAGPTHTTSSWWESTAGPAGPPPDPAAGRAYSAPRPQRPASRAYPPSYAPDPEPLDLGKTFNDLGRAMLDEGSGGIRGRAIRAVVGWLPLAFGIGWLAGEMTGCGRFAATCDGSADPFVIALQVGLLALLLAVPILASLTTMATITLLFVAAFVALVLSATGAAADGDSRRAALGAVLLLAWFAGLAIAGVRRVRALPARADPTRPVS